MVLSRADKEGRLKPISYLDFAFTLFSPNHGETHLDFHTKSSLTNLFSDAWCSCWCREQTKQYFSICGFHNKRLHLVTNFQFLHKGGECFAYTFCSTLVVSKRLQKIFSFFSHFPSSVEASPRISQSSASSQDGQQHPHSPFSTIQKVILSYLVLKVTQDSAQAVAHHLSRWIKRAPSWCSELRN